eukprot:3378893-Prorocentrum_lima.AAC.1
MCIRDSAIAVTCNNVGMQNRLQVASRQVLQEEMRYVIGFAEPAWKQHNASVLQHTIFRGK